MIDGYTLHMRRKKRAKGTVRLRLHYINKFSDWLGKDLREAEHDDFDNYIEAHPHWLTNTQQSALASLKALYAWALMEGRISQNPMRDVAAIKVHRRRPRLASEEAIAQAIECDSDTDRAMVMLGAECGMRVTEIATLHRKDREGDWLRVVGKGNKLRSLYLSPELAALLDHIEQTTMRHGWYFPGRSGIYPVHQSTAWRHISAVLHSNPHSLRRRAGTIVYRKSGNDIRLAQQFLGHKLVTTTELYLDISDDALERAATLTRIGSEPRDRRAA